MEKHLEARLKFEIRQEGGEAFKFVCPGMRGAPDRIVIVAGRLWFVETKTDVGSLSPLQRAFHKLLNRLGFPVHVVKNIDQLNTFLNEVRTARIPGPRD